MLIRSISYQIRHLESPRGKIILSARNRFFLAPLMASFDVPKQNIPDLHYKHNEKRHIEGISMTLRYMILVPVTSPYTIVYTQSSHKHRKTNIHVRFKVIASISLAFANVFAGAGRIGRYLVP